MPRKVLFGFAVITLVVVAGFWWTFGTVRNVVAPNADDVYFLQNINPDDGDIAVLLHPVVTGGAPMLVTDPAIIAAAKDVAHLTDRDTAGQAVGTLVLMMMGGQNLTPVVSVFQGRNLVAHYDCNMQQCRPDGWLAPGFTREIGALSGAGQQAVEVRDTYFDYDDYKTAHATALADPTAVFASRDGTTLLPPQAPSRDFRFLLPTELITIVPGTMSADVDTAAQLASAQDRIAPVVASAGGTVISAAIDVFPAPFVTDVNGFGVGTQDLRVADIAIATPNFTVTIPNQAVSMFMAAAEGLAGHHFDASVAQPYIDATATAAGLSGCDNCVLDAGRVVTDVTVTAFADPSWILNYVKVAP